MKNIIPLICLISLTTQAGDFTEDQLSVVKDIIWAADKTEVPRELLLAICWGESSFNKNSTHMDHGSLSYNVCQVKLATAQFMDKYWHHKIPATPERLEDPKINAFYAAKFLKWQLQQYHGDWKLAVDAYNKFIAKGPDTPYVKKFLKNKAFIHSCLKTAIMGIRG